MKYISINSVVDAFNGCKGKTLNKFWGLIAILKVIDQKIIPAKPYVFKTSEVSNWLEEVFRFEDNPKRYNTSAVWTVIFSSHWTDYVPEQMFAPKSKPNVYDVATWFFRTKTFDDDITSEKVISEFIDSLHLNKEEIDEWFSFEKKEIVFTETAYRDSEILLQFDNSFPESLTISFETPTFIKSRPGSLGQAPFVQTLYANQMTQKCLILTQLDFNDFYPFNSNDLDVQMNNNQPLQQIFYGAPGTGKSNTIKKQTAQAEKNGRVFRTTFHPDSDYSTFVGCYKPKMKPTGVTLASGEKEEVITYKFVPQAFTNAYVKAWNTTENVYLIIEEINRGNCAQIFGDLFQLLDRDDNGKSEYPIDADTDLRNHVSLELAKSTRDDFPEGVKEGKKLVLPPNLYIWATMNTSDQSLFPVDSAFKRRWDWVYIPIAKSNEDEFFIKVGDKCYDWWTFISQMNSVVESVTSSEDKQLGYYFCKPDEGSVISAKRFVSKVLFYLWNDVFKNYGFDATLDGNKVFACKDGNGKDAVMTFTSFFDKYGDPNLKQIEQLMKNLGIGPEENIPQTTATTNGPKPKRNYDKFVIEGETDEHPKYEIASEVVRKYIKNNNGKTAKEVADYWENLMKDEVGIPNFIMTKAEYDNQKSKTAKSKSNEIECGDGEFVYVTTHLWGDDFDYISKFVQAVNNETDLGIKIKRVQKD